MKILLVGIDHELQLSRAENDTEARRALKDQLNRILMSEIPKRLIDFIAEESKEGEVTIAQEFANASSPCIPWLNIWMTHAEREAAGIGGINKRRPGHPDYETMTYWIECRMPEDEIREDFFINRTLTEARDAKRILMLLGDLHVDAVSEKLHVMGHDVEVNHDLFPVRRWE
jgi:hypothetical protein